MNKELQLWGLIVGLFFSCYLFSVDHEIQAKYQEPLDFFSKIQSADPNVYPYESTVNLFVHFSLSHTMLLKQLGNDITQLKKDMKSLSDNNEAKKLLDQLIELRLYMKQQKYNYEAALFHIDLKEEYEELFNLVEHGKDVVKFLEDKNVSNQDLIRFVTEIQMAHKRVERFEDLIHADDIDLKLANYVFKIELIKLRNAILFHEAYKKLPNRLSI